MSTTIKIPEYLISKTGEVIEQKFLNWVSKTQQKLKKAFPIPERAFCRILDKMLHRLGNKWKRRLHYTRQKYFIVSPGVVFFGDFYFRNARLLIEIDGYEHTTSLGKDKDEWRTKLISAWKVTTARIKNDDVINKDFREVEQWFVNQVVNQGKTSRIQLASAYVKMKRKFPQIYQEQETITTYRTDPRKGRL